MDIFVPIRFRTSIQLAPSDLVATFDQVIINKVRASLEGVCSRYGYIRPGSTSILRRSAGSFIKQHFNGHIKFELVCKAEVCNPAIGSVFRAIVKNKNALGIHAESTIEINGVHQPVLDIIIPKRSAGITSSINLEDIHIGETIHVEVLGKRYQLHDKKISIIGRAIQEAPKASLSDNVAINNDDIEDPIIPTDPDIDLLETDSDNESKEDDKQDDGADTDDDDAYTQKGEGDEDDEVVQVDDEFIEDDDDLVSEGGSINDDDCEEY